MTDHGGAASPRTDAEWRALLAERIEVAMSLGLAAGRAEAAQESLAPEGRWAPATAKGTAIGVDEWGRGLFVRVSGEAPAPERLRAIVKRLVSIAAGHTPQSAGDHNIYTLQLGERFIEEAREALRATPPTPAEPPRPDEPVHVHVAGAGEGGAICADCGHDFRERCHARLLDETPYRCGGPQTGQPKPHTACNCTPRAEARPPEGLDPDRLARALDRAGIAQWLPKWTPAEAATRVAAEYARLSAGGATKP